LRVLEGQGIDPFLFLVVPRAVAMAVASFTLGVVFVFVALIVGFVSGSLLGEVNHAFLSFLDELLAAMGAVDFLVFLAKMVLIGLMVALVACLTAFRAGPRDQLAELQSGSFLRGLVAVLLSSVVLSFVV
jgi:phospholipid/cholesterol/gamma-HCH transport system permease protein